MSLDITDYSLDCFNMIFDLDKDENLLDDIKSAIWSQFNAVVAATSYNQVPEKLRRECDGDEEQANRKYFGVQSLDDAFASSTLDYIYIEAENYFLPKIYLAIVFQIPWEDEHGISFHIENGKIANIE
nr:hypothetical protein [Agarilytica rhodophyticola]